MTTSTTIKQIIKSGVIFGAALQGAYAANVVEQPGKADIDIDAANPDPDIVITDGGSAGNYGLEFKLDTDADYTGVISSSIWVYAAKSGLGTLSLTNSNSFVAELSVLEGGLALDGVQVVHPLFQFVQGTATTISVNGATQISALGGDAGAMLILNSELTLDQTRDTS